MNKKLKIICLSLAFLIVFATVGKAFSFPGDVKEISGRKYYAAVKEAIDEAEESIFMVMYIVDLDERSTSSYVYKLCEALVEAKKRDVEVKIILDQNIDFRKQRKEGTWQVEGKNENAFRYFTKHGLNCFYDQETTLTHNKVIVIDKQIVILGSTNWSNSAIRRNNETSVLIESKELAKSILDDFSDIAIDYEASKPDEEKEPPLAIYRLFLEDESLAGNMLIRHDERSFDVYLLLLNEYEGSPQFEFDYDRTAKLLGLGKKMSVNAYRRQLNKTLRKLDDRYNLIGFKPNWGKNAQVILFDLEDKSKTFKYPEGNFFCLPGEYFTYGWDKKLSFRAKYCYFISLYKASRSPDNPWWFAAQETLSKQFHLHRDTVSKGMLELRRLNLIDVEYSSIEEGYEKREPTRYKVLDLYSPKRQKEKIMRLERLYGKKKVKEAREFAKVTLEENDPQVIEDIIHLIDEYGKDKYQQAIDIVAKKAIDNPKRTHSYVVGILKRSGKPNLAQPQG